MPALRVHGFGLSIDGFGAGPRQSLEHPMGLGGMALHEWVFPTQTFRRLHADMALPGGDGEGTTGIDERFAARGFEGIGAWIMGRNMFGPVRGPWAGEPWTGWWGADPPFHAPVFVLTHHPRDPIPMQGGTTFHFVTGGPRDAYDRAMDAAGGMDVRVGGGAATIRQFLADRLIDEMHLAIGPVLLGSGEHLLGGLNLPALGYHVADVQASPAATHVVISRAG